MTTQSSKIKPRFLRYFLYKLYRLKYISILSAVLAFFGYPLYSFYLSEYDLARYEEHILNGSHKRVAELDVIVSGFGTWMMVISVAGLMLLTFWAVMDNYRYLYNKKYVNMDLTLPVSHRERFFGDMLSAAVSTIGPHAIGIAIGCLMRTRLLFVDLGMMYKGFASSVNTEWGSMYEVMIIGMAECLILLVTSLFLISSTGRAGEAVIMTLLIYIAVPVSLYFIGRTAITSGFGLPYEEIYFGSLPLALNFIMALTTPVGLIPGAVGMVFGNSVPIAASFVVSEILYLTVLTAGAYFLQEHRRAERTGNAYVYRYARPVYLGIVILAITSFYAFRILAPDAARDTGLYGSSVPDYTYVFMWLLITFVVYLAAEAISGEKIKRLPFAMLRYAATVGVCFLICSVSVLTDGFGETGYIPSESDVESSFVRLIDEFDFLDMEDAPYDKLTALQKKLISDRRERDLNARNFVSLYITYNLKDGRTVDREYWLDREQEYEAFAFMFDCKYLTQKYKVNSFPAWEDLCVYLYDSSVPPEEEGYGLNMRVTDVPPEKLEEAMIADAENVTFEQMYLSPYREPVYILVGDIGNDRDSQGFYIYPFFENTISLLEEYGVDMYAYENEVTEAYIIKYSFADISSDHSVGYLETYYSVHNGVSAAIENGNMRTLDMQSPQYAELLTAYAGEKTMYSEMGDRYAIVLTRKSYVHSMSGVEESYDWTCYPVTEQFAQRAAEIWANSPSVSPEELTVF